MKVIQRAICMKLDSNETMIVKRMWASASIINDGKHKRIHRKSLCAIIIEAKGAVESCLPLFHRSVCVCVYKPIRAFFRLFAAFTFLCRFIKWASKCSFALFLSTSAMFSYNLLSEQFYVSIFLSTRAYTSTAKTDVQSLKKLFIQCTRLDVRPIGTL